MDDFEKEIKLEFLAEASQLLADAEQAFLDLENDQNNESIINEIFRLAHNLKGTSRAVGFEDVALFTHEMENLILKIKEKELTPNDQIVSVLLDCSDHLNTMIGGLQEDLDAKFESDDIIQKIIAAMDGEQVSGENIEDSDGLDLSENELMSIIDDLEEPAATEEELPMGVQDEVEEETHLAPSPSETDHGELKVFQGSSEEPTQVLTEETSQPQVTTEAASKPIAKAQTQSTISLSKKSSEDDSIRISLSKVEKLNNFVGELVIIQTVLNQKNKEQKSLASKSLSQLAKLSKEIQDISMSLRMVPVKLTLQKLNRIVRDTSKTLNKKVKLEISGEETEIDKTVLEHLSDPLVHIVRNSVDHGLESTEDRIKAGKSETGNVNINAFHQGNNLVIEVKDDGKGIDHEAIKASAIKKGIIKPDTQISPQEAVELVFHPGFSTKSEVSEISGRGVGMDVVKTNIKKLGGEVKIKTELGKGTTLSVSLPLTMAIIEGMVVAVDDHKFVIPLSQIQESLKPSQEQIHEMTGVGTCLNLRGEVIPTFSLKSALKLKGVGKRPYEQISIIVQTEKVKFSVLVDDILHQQQVVVKKIGKEIKDSRGYMGTSILGDGKPSFILDLLDLFKPKEAKEKISRNISKAA